jgi:Trypsin
MKFSAFALMTLLLVACSGSVGPDPSSAPREDAGAPDPAATIDHLEIVRGVPDRGRNPAVVAIGIADRGLCTGTLIAKDVVLTARHCVAKTAASVRCPADAQQVYGAHAPQELAIYTGDVVDGQSPAARGRELVMPEGITLCDADIAAIVLDTPILNIKPVGVRVRPLAYGERVASVGYGKRGDRLGAGDKVFREHVAVVSLTPAEFVVGEATCQGDSGGPALDEATGELIGVVSRGGPSCSGPNVHNIYTRADAFAWLIDAARKRSGPVDKDGNTKGAAPAPPTSKPESDMGVACMHADDCSTNLCVRGEPAPYCSRTCASGDRCPPNYHCKKLANMNAAVCIRVR